MERWHSRSEMLHRGGHCVCGGCSRVWGCHGGAARTKWRLNIVRKLVSLWLLLGMHCARMTSNSSERSRCSSELKYFHRAFQHFNSWFFRIFVRNWNVFTPIFDKKFKYILYFGILPFSYTTKKKIYFDRNIALLSAPMWIEKENISKSEKP